MKQSILNDPTDKEEIKNRTIDWTHRLDTCIADPANSIEVFRSLREEMRNEHEFAKQTDNYLLESISQEVAQSAGGRITKGNVKSIASDLKIGLSYHLHTDF
ncbi:hypothetical protein M5C72_08515 [Companilactobacillus allii]|uniref:Uncharacterized protein n=1 Tax=Companilactobacillus allii TaxID=1847728 RepID=A0A1P8Q5I8_9LACO|nr:hypothetical protein [Companilactobacillus allii]APX73124.1 hypothetical protein BTM29_11420 [Companilactobacillus allii]USQ67925.1 hypothetical protein M5C72_08515 [Companilactobacillus allii]